MPNIILFDDSKIYQQLLPLTFTRPTAGIRCGILTIAEKWELWLNCNIYYQTNPVLSKKFSSTSTGEKWFINGALCPDESLIKEIINLPYDTALISENKEILALKSLTSNTIPEKWQHLSHKIYNQPFSIIRQLWDIFLLNGLEITKDFQKITLNRKSMEINDPYTAVYNQKDIFIESGAKIKAAILNAENGPIYIGKDALIQEGSCIQGPFSIGTSSILAQGTKIRPNTTIGPYSKVGGEINNSVIFGFSNKGHDGYLGNAVLGEWCNLGANTNNSNLKNDHGIVKLYNYRTNQMESTGLTSCGLIMGDYSKAAISTMFNTGTVVGVAVNLFGYGFQPKHIASFSWGGNPNGFAEYRLDKVIHVIKDTIERRNMVFEQIDVALLNTLFENTQTIRNSFIKS